LTVVALVALGWQFARDVGRSAGPLLFRRMDPGTAGTVGFLIRLTTILVAVLVAARIAGLDAQTLTVGGAFTAVVVGLAAQQTLGNLIAGTVLLSARPFRVGDRVRLQGGGLAGTVEGVVASLGLLYTTLASGDDLIMVPNSVVLSVAIVPLREPDGVDLRARLRPGVTPEDIKRLLSETLETPIRGEPHVALEELDGDEVVVRIQAVPEHAEGRLAPGRRGAVDGGARDRAGRRLSGPGYDRRWRCPSPRSAAIFAPPSRRDSAAAVVGATPPKAAPSRIPERRHVHLAPVALDRLDDALGDLVGVLVPTVRGRWTSASWNMPASRMKPGKTTLTPTRCRAGRRAAPGRSRVGPNFVALYTALPSLANLPDSDDTSTIWPLPRATMRSPSRRLSTIGVRRFTASTRSISSMP
jgi:hypothetical protein